MRFGRDGRAHIYGVIGPDEYHEPVDDNAFTNVIARWNLRRRRPSTGSTRASGPPGWRSRDALVDGYDRASGLYEQFAGFFELEPLVIEEIAPRRPIAAELLLGAERTTGAQVLKQADVLMLHHLLPDEAAPGSLVPNLDFYEPRTRTAARCRRLSTRACWPAPAATGLRSTSLEIAARMDLDDLTGTHRRRTAPGDDGRACGRRSHSGSAASVRAATRCSSIRGCRRSGTPSSSRCASAAGRFGSASIAAA